MYVPASLPLAADGVALGCPNSQAILRYIYRLLTDDHRCTTFHSLVYACLLSVPQYAFRSMPCMVPLSMLLAACPALYPNQTCRHATQVPLVFAAK